MGMHPHHPGMQNGPPGPPGQGRMGPMMGQGPPGMMPPSTHPHGGMMSPGMGPPGQLGMGPPGQPGMGPPGMSMGPTHGMGPMMGPPGMPHGKGYPGGPGPQQMPNQPMIFNAQNPNAPPIHLCGVCRNEVQGDSEEGLLCESGCNFWFHRQCVNMNPDAYQMLRHEVFAEWACDNCIRSRNVPPIKLRS